MQQQQIQIQQQQLEQQQQQTALLREGLIAAMEKVNAPKEPKPGNVSNFRKLNPAEFSGTGKPLEAEKWLVDTTNLLKAARISDADQVEVVRTSY